MSAAASGRLGTGIFAKDRAHRIDVLIDELHRNAACVRRVLDQAAQAVRGRRNRGIAEGRGFAFDIVRGAEKRTLVVPLVKPLALRSRGGSVEPFAFRLHPVARIRPREPASACSARPDRIFLSRPAARLSTRRAANWLRHDHLVVAVSDDRGLVLSGEAMQCLLQTPERAFSNNVFRMTSALPRLAALGADVIGVDAAAPVGAEIGRGLDEGPRIGDHIDDALVQRLCRIGLARNSVTPASRARSHAFLSECPVNMMIET